MGGYLWATEMLMLRHSAPGQEQELPQLGV